jgi:DNA sulfur modification protein DndB
MNKGAKLNRRVWKLFETSGFRTLPNSESAAEYEVALPAKKKIPVDLHASDAELCVTVIGSNKSGSVDRWTQRVHSYLELGRAAKADKVLFVATGHALSEEQKTYALERGACVWGEEELAYFEAVSEAIGTYAKYEIIHSLGLKTHEEKDTHKVLAIRLTQPTSRSGSELFMFTLSPERLLKTCVVYRRAQGNSAAYQRILRKNRLPKVQSFVTRPDSLLPTDLIVYLDEKVTVDRIQLGELKDKENRPITVSKSKGGELVVLNIPMEYASLELVDGQHRLYGFVNTDPATRKEFNLVVLGMKGLSQKQRRDTFVAINDNSRRMDANLVAYLKYTTDDSECQKSSELMAIRIAVDLNKTAPFRGAIRLLDMPSCSAPR